MLIPIMECRHKELWKGYRVCSLQFVGMCYDAIRCDVMLCFEYLNILNITSHRSYFSKIRNNVASQLCFEYSKRNIASDIAAMFVNEKWVVVVAGVLWVVNEKGVWWWWPSASNWVYVSESLDGRRTEDEQGIPIKRFKNLLISEQRLFL
jgi:hypothetical protein